MALSYMYDVCVYILYDHPGFLSATERSSPYRNVADGLKNRTVIVPSSRSHDAPTM